MCVGSSRTAGSIQGGPISTETRVNERIRVPEVRLIGPGGEQVGIVRIEDALRVAADADLDLVEVAPNARPPVCKIMDYGKWKYDRDKKKKAQSDNSQSLREVKLRPKIGDHDLEVKTRQVGRLLDGGDKVKVTLRFRGREIVHQDLAQDLLQRIGQEVSDQGEFVSKPSMQGRTMSAILAPV